MKEIGGYIELDTYHMPLLHENAVALNCGRSCLAYLLKSRKIKKLKVPYFICSSILDVCDRENVEKNFYHIGLDFKPLSLTLADDEWLYLVNFYGQLTNDEIGNYVEKYKRVIVDQANGYFEEPIPGVDTLYTCRKWFGVPDGAFLYTDNKLNDPLPQDESFDRMKFLLGRYERTAAEFYDAYKSNNVFFMHEPIKRMSKLTNNLLRGIDYKMIETRRKENFEFLNKSLYKLNRLTLKTGLFMYPFMIENGELIRRELQKKKIYIPTLWPSVFEITGPDEIEYQMAKNILPLPIDQRYDIADMNYIVQEIKSCIN